MDSSRQHCTDLGGRHEDINQRRLEAATRPRHRACCTPSSVAADDPSKRSSTKIDAGSSRRGDEEERKAGNNVDVFVCLAYSTTHNKALIVSPSNFGIFHLGRERPHSQRAGGESEARETVGICLAYYA